MTSSLAKGLFQKAIGQAASYAMPAADKDANGYERGAGFATLALEDSGSGPAIGDSSLVAALRALPVETIQAAELTSGWDTGSRTVVDGWVVPDSARSRLHAGKQV